MALWLSWAVRARCVARLCGERTLRTLCERIETERLTGASVSDSATYNSMRLATPMPMLVKAACPMSNAIQMEGRLTPLE